MTENVGGRFLVITGQPQVFPGACLVCKGINGPFIDTLQGDDYLGGFFFCFDCVKEMSSVLGITVDTNRLEQHKAYVQGARDTIGNVERHLRGYLDKFDLNSAAIHVPDFTADGPSGSDDSEAVASNEPGAERSGVSASELNLEVDGFTFDEGPASVSSGAGNGSKGVRAGK